jgi:hypothetical protein
MKLLVAAAVAAFALPAFAQDTPPAAPAPQTTPMPPADPAAAPAPMPADPTAAPAPMAAAPAPMAPPATSDGNYPPCTRTVTDHCTERSNAKGERLHSTPRKPV